MFTVFVVVDDDPKHAILPYDAIMLLAPKRAGDQQLQAALRPLLGKIDIADMREANLHASGNDSSSSPDAVALALGPDRKAPGREPMNLPASACRVR